MKTAAYLRRGETYVIYELDDDLRERDSRVVPRSELPRTVADKCDRYEPHAFREVRIPDADHN